MLSLHNKRIILGITGGIAAYKSAELCRQLIKAGAEVRVVMTPNACEFITPLTMQALSGNRVSTTLLDTEAEAAMGHIELARWADLILIAPASASFMSRLATGEASDLLATLCLARLCPLALAPAMNQAMWSNNSTQQNLSALQQKQILIWGPDSGDQACGDIGPGRMIEPQALAALAAAQFSTGALAGVSVTITAGPTREALDPVRYISNHSSGKMAYALAQAAVEAGALVTLVSGPVSLPAPEQVKLINVDSAEQMLAACLKQPGEIFIGVAAVADYRPQQTAEHKIKKQDETLTLQLIRNPDILATVAGLANKPFCVGFAAETENLQSNAQAKLKAKKIDLIFANQASETFGKDEASLSAYWSEGAITQSRLLPLASKPQLARQMIEMISKLKSA